MMNAQEPFRSRKPFHELTHALNCSVVTEIHRRRLEASITDAKSEWRLSRKSNSRLQMDESSEA